MYIECILLSVLPSIQANDIPGGELLIAASSLLTSPAIHVLGWGQSRLIHREAATRFNHGGYDVLQPNDLINRLFARQNSCPSGYGACSNNPSLCCPANGKCCEDGNCCRAGYECVFATGEPKAKCCPAGSICPNTCEDPGFVPCPDESFCCPSTYSCYRDTKNAGMCQAPGAPTLTDLLPTILVTPTPSESSITTPLSLSTTDYLSSLTPNPGSSTTQRPIGSEGIPLLTPTPQNLATSSISTGVIIGAVLGGLAGLALLVFGILFIWTRKQNNPAISQSPMRTFAPQMHGIYSDPPTPTRSTPSAGSTNPTPGRAGIGTVMPPAYNPLPYNYPPPSPMMLPPPQEQPRHSGYYPNTLGDTASFYGAQSVRSPTLRRGGMRVEI